MTTAKTDTAPADIRHAVAAISSNDKEAQGAAFQLLMRETERPIPWAGDVWDDLIAALGHRDNRTRAIAGQVLCNLAMSDTGARLKRDIDKIYAATLDERFVTARHVLLALWKTGVCDAKVRGALVKRLAERFETCLEEKNGTLIRYDILCTLRSLYDATGDQHVKDAALALIPLEADAKYRKKYAGAWREP
jgi:hypothetical protein